MRDYARTQIRGFEHRFVFGSHEEMRARNKRNCPNNTALPMADSDFLCAHHHHFEPDEKAAGVIDTLDVQVANELGAGTGIEAPKVALRNVLRKTPHSAATLRFITNCHVTVPTNVLSTFVCATCIIIFLT